MRGTGPSDEEEAGVGMGQDSLREAVAVDFDPGQLRSQRIGGK